MIIITYIKEFHNLLFCLHQVLEGGDESHDRHSSEIWSEFWWYIVVVLDCNVDDGADQSRQPEKSMIRT